MPEKPTMITRLALVLDEPITLAVAHERTEITRYRRLAFSFLPFDITASRLLASLGIQCEIRLEELQRLSHQLGLAEACSSPAAMNAEASAPFFIHSSELEYEALTQASSDTRYSLHFYEHLREASTAPALYLALTGVIKQKQAEHLLLESFLASRSNQGQVEQRA